MSKIIDIYGQERELVLYKYDWCFYCRFVMAEIDKMNMEIEYKDTLKEPVNRQDLIRMGGKSQVPCLLIDGQPLYESRDIVRYLKENYS